MPQWDKIWERLLLAGRTSIRLLFTPLVKTSKLKRKSGSVSKSYTLNSLLFPNIPEHYPFYKKLFLLKNQSSYGKLWDVGLVFLSIAACIFYVAGTYDSSYHAVRVYSYTEQIVTWFFLFDFIYSLLASPNYLVYLTNLWTIIDVATIAPVFITWGLQSIQGKQRVNLSIFRFVRILRLVRILRTFKLLGGMSGVRRQIITLSLTLISLIFMAAGVIQIMENDVKQILKFQCKHISVETDWLPSCSPYRLDDCDCTKHNCIRFYSSGDLEGEPSGVQCITLNYLEAVYYMVVTVATVGYGDIFPTTPPSKAVVILFVILSLVLIPMQVNQLTTLLSISTLFREPYVPNANGNETHIILCGSVSDCRRVEAVFREFFHPDRNNSHAPDFHIVILTPVDPSDSMRNLVMSPLFDTKVTYIIGSALSMDDLQKARADIAAAMIFLCNSDANSIDAKVDDAATVLRTLSVNNYNRDLECLVQVLTRDDRDLLKDSDVDVIMCMDEYKTALQARNSICPGLSTLVENIFHSFSRSNVANPFAEPWLVDYTNGAVLEPYFIPLAPEYLATLGYEWTLVAEGVYLEYDVMMIGVSSSEDHDVILNPSFHEMSKFSSPQRFFKLYSLAVVLAEDQTMAANIAQALSDPYILDRIVNKLVVAEHHFAVRKPSAMKTAQHNVRRNRPSMVGSSGAGAGADHNIEELSFREILKEAKVRCNTSTFYKHGDDVVHADSVEDQDNIRSAEKEKGDDEFLGFVRTSQAPSRRSSVAKAMDSRKGLSLKSASKKLAKAMNILRKSDRVSRTESYDSVCSDSGDDSEEAGTPNGTSMKGSLWSKAALNRTSTTPSSSFTSTPSSMMAGKSTRLPSQIVASSSASVVKLNRAVSSLRSALSAHGGIQKKSRRATILDEVFEEESQHQHDELILQDLGMTSMAFADASDLTNHIVLIGCMVNLLIYVCELRRPLIIDSAYHPIVIVSPEEPAAWLLITQTYDDVYFIKGNITASTDFNRANIKNAASLVFLANRDSLTRVEKENLDADTLFTYLKLEKYIPPEVFFTVELSSASNIAVLNSTLSRADPANAAARPQEGTSKKSGAAAVSIKESKQIRGAFTSQRRGSRKLDKSGLAAVKQDRKSAGKTGRHLLNHSNQHAGSEMLPITIPGRRLSSLYVKEFKATDISIQKVQAAKDIDAFWTMYDTHHMLPVFASGRAFVPTTFDSIMFQSFYSVFTPLLVEKLVCGQKYQTMFQIAVPYNFHGHYFVDLYRAFLARNLLVMALYRGAFIADKSPLPFVLTAPKPDTLLRKTDRIFIYANPLEMKRAMDISLVVPFGTHSDGRAFVESQNLEEEDPLVKQRRRSEAEKHKKKFAAMLVKKSDDLMKRRLEELAQFDAVAGGGRKREQEIIVVASADMNATGAHMTGISPERLTNTNS